MKDLINNFEGNIKELKIKYDTLLNDLDLGSGNKNDFLIVLEYTTNHLEENHKDLTSDEKAYLVTLIYKLYKEKKYLEVGKSINVFIKFHENRYSRFKNNYPPIKEADIEIAFIDYFVRKL